LKALKNICEAEALALLVTALGGSGFRIIGEPACRQTPCIIQKTACAINAGYIFLPLRDTRSRRGCNRREPPAKSSRLRHDRHEHGVVLIGIINAIISRTRSLFRGAQKQKQIAETSTHSRSDLIEGIIVKIKYIDYEGRIRR